MDEIILKKASCDINNELNSIGFDKSYFSCASKKYSGFLYKLFNLKPHEANILKQICLSLGFDCAVSRETVMCKCEKTDCIIFATDAQIEKLSQKLLKQPFRLSKISGLLTKFLSQSLQPLVIKTITFDWSKPYIAGILNVTPDSFSDGGLFSSPDTALKQVEKMISDGCDFIDIGGESTRPGADSVSCSEEIDRVIPVIEKIRNLNINIPISIDTRHFETAKAAYEAGIDIINDVSGLSDEKLLSFVCEKKIPIILMHSDKIPAVSDNFTSLDPVEQIYFSLYKKTEKLLSLGFNRSDIIIDPGIGFGKSADVNFEILKRIDEFSSLKFPLMAGISRKSFIRNEFDLSPKEADIPSALYGALLPSVNIHRVHNVKLAKNFLEYASRIRYSNKTG